METGIRMKRRHAISEMVISSFSGPESDRRIVHLFSVIFVVGWLFLVGIISGGFSTGTSVEWVAALVGGPAAYIIPFGFYLDSKKQDAWRL